MNYISAIQEACRQQHVLMKPVAATYEARIPNSKGLLFLFSLLPFVAHVSQPTQYSRNIATLHKSTKMPPLQVSIRN